MSPANLRNCSAVDREKVFAGGTGLTHWSIALLEYPDEFTQSNALRFSFLFVKGTMPKETCIQKFQDS
jgi:hypothetical protein